MTKRKRGGGAKTKKRKNRRRTKRGQPKQSRRFADFLIISVLFLAAYFAIFGGEFTIFQLKGLEALELERRAELAAVQAEIDSLLGVAERLRYDADAIERVARERYGMIRDGEILYRFREAEPAAEAEIDQDEGSE